MSLHYLPPRHPYYLLSALVRERVMMGWAFGDAKGGNADIERFISIGFRSMYTIVAISCHLEKSWRGYPLT